MGRFFQRPAAVALACVLVAAAAPAPALAAAPQLSLPWLSVRAVDASLAPGSARRFVIADEYGRELTLRGACVETEERNLAGVHTQRSVDPADYTRGRCPDNFQGYQQPPVCGVDAGAGRFLVDASDGGRNDFAQARALGINIVRLCLSWSELEYTPGVYNATYIARVQQLLDWAEEQGVYVILDFHEDLYSQFILANASDPGIPGLLTPASGQDGAPAWAIRSDGWPSLGLFGVGNLNLAMLAAFDSLYGNKLPEPAVPQGEAPGPGLRDHYIGAVAALARAVANRSVVAGIELVNEPEMSLSKLIDFQGLASEQLYPLYAAAVQAVTGVRDGLPTCNISSGGGLPASPCAYPDLGVHTRHLIFAEPNSLRNEFDFSPNTMGPWTTYANIVHTPHVYTHVFTIDQELAFLNLTWPPSWSFAYDTAWAEAANMSAALFVTEFGDGMLEDGSHVRPTMDEAERHMVGNTLWSWKSNCAGCTNDTWTTFLIPQNESTPLPIPPNGELFPSRRNLLGRVHTRGAVGEILAYTYNMSSQSYAFIANISAAQMLAIDGARAAEAAACAAGAGAADGYLLLDGARGWALCGEATAPRSPAPRLTLAAADFDARLPRALAANGSVTEIYTPANIAADPAVVGNAELVGVVAWPDGSRSAFFRPLAAGVYSLAVPPAAGAAAATWTPAGAVAAALAVRPTAADAAAAAATVATDGSRVVQAWLERVADGVARADLPSRGPGSVAAAKAAAEAAAASASAL